MRTSPLLLLALLSACSILEPDLPIGRPRIVDGPGGKSPDAEESVHDGHRADTLFYVSAVSFPVSYDWRRDTSYGATACTLKFFRGSEPLLSVAAGPSERISPSPDRHHIIGGRLYSQYQDIKGTTIKCGGAVAAEWPEPEYIIGLLPKDGALYTIGRSASSSGFTYRRDGEVLLKVDRGTVFGGFDKDSCPSTGALCEDGGAVCFAYKTELNGMQAAYIVRDGEAELLLCKGDTEIFDVKSLNGKVVMFYNENGIAQFISGGWAVNIRQGGTLLWDDGEVLWYDGRPCVLGHFHKPGEPAEFGLGWTNTVKRLFDKDAFVYYSGNAEELVAFGQPRKGWENYYFFNRHCACLVGEDLAAVLTPRLGSDGDPFLTFKGRKVSYGLHGFLSGVAVEIVE